MTLIEQLNRWDTSLFWFINSHHCAASDWLLWTVSQGWAWIPVLAVAYGAVCHRVGLRRWWLVLLGVGLCFLLSDRITVMAFKEVVCRLRPCHALEGVRMYHTHCGGLYGFVSSHAANATSVALFLSLIYKQASPSDGRWKSRLFACLMALWVVLVGYSRPYLGKHYPGDVLCGTLVGLGIGALVYFLYQKWLTRSRKDTA